jgi:hypothetical protein
MLITVALMSLSVAVHVNSPTEQPAVKKIPFQAECVITENQPLPLTHVLRLKNRAGSTKSKLPNARLLTESVSVFKRCIPTHKAPVTRTEYAFPNM